MKYILFILSFGLVIALFSCSSSHDDKLLIREGWLFMPGDDLQRAIPGFDDQGWKPIDPTKPWEDQGYKEYDGISWYRLTVELPSSLVENADENDSLQIFLGKIDDCDQVFLNGQLIGENSLPVAGRKTADSGFIKSRGIWNKPRTYLLHRRDPAILWDRENVIAVRCYDHGGPGGMYGKRFEISATSLADRISADFSRAPFMLKDSVITGKVVLTNRSARQYEGECLVRVTDHRTGFMIFSDRSPILLTGGQEIEKTLVFKKVPGIPATCMVTFTESGTGKKAEWTSEVPYILTPPVPEQPRINGAQVFGARPHSPFLFQIAATGRRPMTFGAAGLPEGLILDPNTGRITGMVKKRGEFSTLITAENSEGKAERELKIIIGDLISLTPPMGWNSWNCWGLSVSDKKVRQSARAMVTSGLINHGWTYINIDDGWEDTHDRDGRILANSKFPDMYGLCHYIHSLGLKAGIYSSPGPKTCGGYEGSYKFEYNDAATYAAWGFDYLKYDWCSYYQIAPDPTPEQMKRPYKEMRHALRRVNRDIHYSLCQYGMGDVWTWGAEVDGNSWRTTGDIEDTWESMTSIGFSQDKCSPFAMPGRWNDPDMLVVGWVGWGPDLHYTRLSPSEQYTHITLWSLLASPLLIGCDLERLDPFTINLLTNDEVLAINQDPLGRQATRVYENERYEVWARVLADSSMAVGLFNKTLKPMVVPVDMRLLQAEGIFQIRDLWTGRDLGYVRNHFEMRTEAHGARLVRLTTKP